MKRRFYQSLRISFVAILIAAGALATFGQNRPYRVSDTQVRTIVTRIETRTDAFKTAVDTTYNRGRWRNNANAEDVVAYIADFETATDRLQQTIGVRGSFNSEVNDVLTRATYIDRFMVRNQLSAAAESQWTRLRADLNTLASYYNLSWNWSRTLPDVGNPLPGGGGGGRGIDARFTGTYRLNTALSDNVTDAIDRSVNVYTTTQRPNMRNNLERRLQSPEMIAFEKDGQSITMASTLSPQVNFVADGIARSETNARGRTIRTTATVSNRSLIINYAGDRVNDFTVTFSPDRNGQMRVTRKLFLENRNETISVDSVYDKTDETARWSTVNTGGPLNGNNNTGNADTFYIPNGLRLTAVLRNSLNTRDTQVGDQFSMEVTGPAQYRGAMIEGKVTDISRSGRVSGRANVSLDFETIRMPNGSSYRFEGLIDSVRSANGDTVSVNNEGVIRDNNQTTKTVTRAGIGAAIGAIIGAIAGGGQGAAIGAGVGAGAGAGSVLIQGRDNIDLGQGTEFSITSSSPNNFGINR